MHTDVWNIDTAAYPAQGTLADKIEYWLRYAILAPSAHNTQPWAYKIEGETLIISLDPLHVLRAGDPTGRQTILGMGAFLENLSIAAQEYGYIVEHTPVSLLRKPNTPLTIVSFTSESDTTQQADSLFTAITQRHTNRGLYQSEPLSANKMNALRATKLEPAVQLLFIEDVEQRKHIGALVGTGVRIGLSLPALKKELAELVSTIPEDKSEGMLIEAMLEHPPLTDSVQSWFVSQHDAQEDSDFSVKKFSTAPLIVVVSLESELPENWLAAGQTMERLLLTAASLGLTHCISAAPAEVPTLAPLLRKETNPLYKPQLVIRLGIPQNLRFTINSPRRNVAT